MRQEEEEEVRFEGNYRGRGKWYPGKVNRDRGDKTSLKEISNDIYMDVMLECSCISFGHTREQD